MFTGIIEELGTVKSIISGGNYLTLRISCEKVLEDTKIGDSIAVNGTCLTVTQMDDQSFEAEVTPETMRRTSFSILRPGSRVNLERALRLGDRLGGHMVSGHVDCTGKIISAVKEGNAVNITCSVPQHYMKYILEKGSVAVDGISLTVARRDNSGFTVALIPHTGEVTTLLTKHRGDPVNIECDCVGKYIEQLMNAPKEEGLTMEKLRAYGYGGGHYGK